MMANGQEVRRRRYSEERKQQVMSECEVALQPMDMRPGAHGYLFANARHTRIELPVHGGYGI